MIIFSNIRFLNQPTKTNRQLVAVDITKGNETYDWIVYAPLVNGAELEQYFLKIANIVENDINNKELLWSNSPHTEEIEDFDTNETIVVDIPKNRIVHPTIPDYVEGLAENKTSTDLNTILQELGTDYWQYPDYAKRIVAPIQLILDDVGIKMYGWFNLNKLPILNLEQGFVHLYCNEILPEHQAIIDGLQGVIIIEDRP